MHVGVACNGCGTDKIMRRAKCGVCPDFDLCFDCHEKFEENDGDVAEVKEMSKHQLKKHPFYLMTEKTRMRATNPHQKILTGQEAIQYKQMQAMQQ